MYDVLISGSGPSGSTAGEIAARAGLKVLIFERHKLEPRFEKPCGGSVPKHVWDKFHLPNNKIAERKVIGNILSAPSNQEFILRSEPNYGWNVKRSVFDKFLIDRAMDNGAEVSENSFVMDVIKNDHVNGVIVKTPDGIKEVQSKITIAADGVGSLIVHKAGIRDKWTSEDLGYCAVGFIKGYMGYEGDFSNNLFYLSEEIAPNAYAWIFPLSENIANVGLGIFKKKGNPMDYLLNKFLNWPRIKNQFKNPKVLWKSNFPIPIQGISKNLSANGILGVGDSVGLVSPIIGEGISYAMLSGKFAAETAIEAIEKEDYSLDILKNYKKKLRKNNIFTIFSAHKMFRDLLMQDLNNNINALINLSNNNSDVQKIIKMALTEEGINDISPELMANVLNLIKDVLKKT